MQKKKEDWKDQIQFLTYFFSFGYNLKLVALRASRKSNSRVFRSGNNDGENSRKMKLLYEI